jgi:hypothetical protein
LWNTNLWPGGIVPYEFDANTTPSQQAQMRGAMTAIESVASIHFVPVDSQSNYLHVRDSQGNNSLVGMTGGSQTVNIYNWNVRYVMCHELLHALGVWHEQSRPDRAPFVQINTANIAVDQTQCGGSCAYNFDIVQADAVGNYDFDSIMHYDQYAFSTNGLPTIAVLPPYEHWSTLIGQRSHLSHADVEGLISRYGPAAPLGWTQATGVGPSPRAAAAMAYDSARAVTVLFGGDALGANNETWEWNGTAWTQRNVTGPSPRFYHAMAYDAARAVTVLFGGQSGAGMNGETWEWNGTAWSQRVSAGPSPRASCAMAYDSARGVTVLFGGATAPTVASAETWEWNGTAWTHRLVSGPSARRAHAMAYDASRGVTVLFGGADGSGNIGNAETWEWNGTAWTQRADAGPSIRAYHSMTYDSARAKTMIFAGANVAQGGALLNDVWELDASGWTSRGNAGPAPRSTMPMAYDASRHVSMIFGGTTGLPLYYNGETWSLGPPPCVPPDMGVLPGPQTVCVGGAATFSAGAPGTGPATYRWRRDGVAVIDAPGHISGAFTPTMTILAAAAADQGAYDCVVINQCVGVSVGAATLTVRSSDFNNDGDSATDADIEAFFACLAGNCCATCGSADFNGDGDSGTDADIEAFFRVLAGGTC